VLWRQPEAEWDVEKAAPEWLEEWTSQEPPPLDAFIKELRTETEKEKEIMPKSDNLLRRDQAIQAEYEQYKKQGFRTGHIYRVLAEKYYLSPLRIRDIVTLAKNKLPNPPK
jgi:flagellar biosynthesis/type III secretory pathway protein FliH